MSLRDAEKPAYGDPMRRNVRLLVPTTGDQDPRVKGRPVARGAHALVRRSAERAKEEFGACSNEARKPVTGNKYAQKSAQDAYQSDPFFRACGLLMFIRLARPLFRARHD